MSCKEITIFVFLMVIKTTGFYDINDKDLKINLIEQSNSQMDTLEIVTKAFIKDFFDRIVDKKLGKPKK